MVLTVTLGVSSLSAQAMSIVYDVNRTIGAGSVVGTITTDGTQGNLVAANITDFSLALNDGIDSFTIAMSSGASIYEAGPSHLTANATGLIYDFAGDPAGEMQFFLGSLGGGWSWALESTAIDPPDGVERIYHSGVVPHEQTANRTGSVVIAAPQTVQLTEPNSLWMLLLGFSVIAWARWSIPK